MTGSRLFLRSFLIQASWNPRDLLGTGVAWALSPFLRGRSPEGEGAVVARYSEPFNAHPFLAGLALGAMVRMERDGVPEETQRRFHNAVRGPLGSLGDGLIWAGWLPLSLLLAGTAYVMGVPPGPTVILFLLLFNGVHLPLRAWAVRTGMAAGMGIAPILQAARLGLWGERSRALGVLLVGVIGGILAVRGAEHLSAPLLWSGAGLGVLFLGVWKGRVVFPGAPGALALLLILLVSVFGA